MQKLRFFFLLFLLPSTLFAQQRSRIELLKSTRMRVDTKTNISYVRNPTFRHDNAILTCDSAVFYTTLNYFEAFKNVHINQADTMNIFSDLLNYDGNTKMAHLINNVRMIDPTSVLTTNILDYDMGLKIGKYLDGGKIVNTSKDVTITSKRGWYFANNNDAWFKLNVDITTPQVKIKSDSVKYNTVSNWTDFYGKTNIKGKDDNLYTENGRYNTKTEDAFFGKKNLYTQGTKSLKGDSLFYNGKQGYGKAIKNILFTDSEDKLELHGQLGEYTKADEKIVVTDHAYVGLATADSVLVKEVKTPDSLWIAADTLQAQMVLQKTLKLISTPIVLKDNEIGAETPAEKKAREAAKALATSTAAALKAAAPKKSPVVVPQKQETSKKDKKNNKETAKTLAEIKAKPDSVIKPPDSIKINLPKALDSAKKTILKPDSILTLDKKKVSKDTIKTTIKAADKATIKPVISTAKTVAMPTKPIVKDSLPFNPADTVRTRSIQAHRNVRVFKANLQAKSDSLFYSAADSTLRWYKDPIIWSESSQQTGDTIYVQFKDKKINNLQVLKNGFMVNTEGDSTKFNQVKGKLMTGFFADGELKTMYVDGNAESIYFTKEKKDGKDVDTMNQTVSARLKFNFFGKELDNIKTIKDVEGAYFRDPESLPKDPHLTGFIWKPELRPANKADIIKGNTTEKPKKENKPAIKGPVKNTSPKKATVPVKKVITPEKALPKKTAPTIKLEQDKTKVDSIKIDTIKKSMKIDTAKSVIKKAN